MENLMPKYAHTGYIATTSLICHPRGDWDIRMPALWQVSSDYVKNRAAR